MITLLQIENFALIDRLRLEPGEGMTALTGETGSGKSIVLDALTFLFGARASAEHVREGAAKAVLEAELELEAGSTASRWLTEEGFDLSDGEGAVLVRRELSASGRGRCAVNGRLATAAQVAALGAHIVEFHAQGSEHALLSSANQRDLFDGHIGAMPLRAQVAASYARVRSLEEKLAKLDEGEREAERQLDYLRFAVEELAGLDLREGESETLLVEKERLANVDALAQASASALEALCGEGDAGTATSLAGRAARELERASRHDAALEPLVRQLAEAVALLDEAATAVSDYAATLEADPGRLAEVDDRLAAVKKALRKYGPTESDAARRLAEMRAQLDGFEARDGDRATLVEMIAAERAVLATRARELHALRSKAKRAFEKSFETIIRDLSMPAAKIEVRMDAVTSGIDVGTGLIAAREGTESVEFHFSANAGESAKPLRKIASGGELSRVLLAMRCLSADRTDVPVMVFDEVDAGLSGAAAAKVGRRLAELAKGRQVLCVTHQASVAACAATHIAVSKSETKGRTIVAVEVLTQNARPRELARLLDGTNSSASSLKLAEELLRRAAS